MDAFVEEFEGGSSVPVIKQLDCLSLVLILIFPPHRVFLGEALICQSTKEFKNEKIFKAQVFIFFYPHCNKTFI